MPDHALFYSGGGGGLALCVFTASANAQNITNNNSGGQIIYHKANAYGTLIVFSINNEHPKFQYVNRSGTIVLQNLSSGNGVKATLPNGGYSIQLVSQGQAILRAHGELVESCAGLNQDTNNTFTGVVTYSQSGGVVASSQMQAMLGCLASHVQLVQNVTDFYSAQGISLSQVDQCLAKGGTNCLNSSGSPGSGVEPESLGGCVVAIVMFAAAAAALASAAADGPVGFVLATAAYFYALAEMDDDCIAN